MARAAQAEAVECPRCGYDVSGVMSLWKTECPVEGRCSECGYEYQWKHLLGPNLGVPRWFFETAHRKKIRAAISTSVRTVAPWWFWKRVPLHAPMSWRRLTGVSVGWFVLASILSIVSLSVESPYTIGMLKSLFISNGSGPPAVLTHSVAETTQMLWITLRSRAYWPLGLGVTNLPRRSEVAIEWLFLATLLIPACSLAVRRTLVAERVRPIHLVRAGTYASVAFLIVLSGWFFCFGAIVVRGHLAVVSIPSWFGTSFLRALLFWPVVSVLWWWCCCRFYLRIRHALWTAFLLNVMAMLGAGVLLYPLMHQAGFWADVFRW